MFDIFMFCRVTVYPMLSLGVKQLLSPKSLSLRLPTLYQLGKPTLTTLVVAHPPATAIMAQDPLNDVMGFSTASRTISNGLFPFVFWIDHATTQIPKFLFGLELSHCSSQLPPVMSNLSCTQEMGILPMPQEVVVWLCTVGLARLFAAIHMVLVYSPELEFAAKLCWGTSICNFCAATAAKLTTTHNLLAWRPLFSLLSLPYAWLYDLWKMLSLLPPEALHVALSFVAKIWICAHFLMSPNLLWTCLHPALVFSFQIATVWLEIAF